MNCNTLNEKRFCKSIMLLKEKKKNLPQYKEDNKGEKIFLSSRLVAKNAERMVMIFSLIIESSRDLSLDMKTLSKKLYVNKIITWSWLHFQSSSLSPNSRLNTQCLLYLLFQLSSGHPKYDTSKGELTFILLPKPALPEPSTSQLLAVPYLQLNQSKPCIILDCFLFYSLSTLHN